MRRDLVPDLVPPRPQVIPPTSSLVPPIGDEDEVGLTSSLTSSLELRDRV
jgi:hypothetical protein